MEDEFVPMGRVQAEAQRALGDAAAGHVVTVSPLAFAWAKRYAKGLESFNVTVEGLECAESGGLIYVEELNG